MFKAGMVSIIGKPNVGKSTLLNLLLKKKISIVTKKPQTTRNEIQGIYQGEDCQIIFIDTPGIHNPKDKLSYYLNKAAINSIHDVDIICVMFASDTRINDDDLKIINILKDRQLNIPIICVVSKIDRMSKNHLILKLEEIAKLYNWTEIIPISCLAENNTNNFLNLIIKYLPVNEKLFDNDQITTSTNEFLIKEIIREKCLCSLQEEVPYSIGIEISKINNEHPEKIKINASIIVERQSQKGIVIGKQGSMIKNIGTKARKDIEQYFNKKCFLELFVKVSDDWKSNQDKIKTIISQ